MLFSRIMYIIVIAMILLSGCGGKGGGFNKIYCLEKPEIVLGNSISQAKQYIDIFWDPNESKGWVAKCGNDYFFKNIDIVTLDRDGGISGGVKDSKIERVIFRTELFSGKDAKSYLRPVFDALKNRFGDHHKEINLKYGEETLPAILWEKGDFLVLYGFPYKEGGLDRQQYYNFELIFVPSEKRWW